MRTTTAIALLAVLAAGGEKAAARDPEAGASAGATTFEALAAAATRTSDVSTLLAPLVDKCPSGEREIDRIRCRAAQAYLRKELPARSFLIAADDPAAVSVSAYDGATKGYRLALDGCIACSKPIAIGRAGEPQFVTLKAPTKEVDPLPKSVEIATGAISFGSLPDAKRWLDGVRPDLRAEFVFRPGDSQWRQGAARGYALELLGGRIYDRCTGEVLLSRPPSSGQAERPAGGRPDERCAQRAVGVAAGDDRPAAGGGNAAAGGRDEDDEERLPSELSRADIADSMSQIRAQVFACYQKYQVPGNIQLDYQVASNGLVQSIRVAAGPLDGTPTGACVLDAGKNARFPHFKSAGPSQKFSYPFFLRK
jgi:hypothetical protein